MEPFSDRLHQAVTHKRGQLSYGQSHAISPQFYPRSKGVFSVIETNNIVKQRWLEISAVVESRGLVARGSNKNIAGASPCGYPPRPLFRVPQESESPQVHLELLQRR